MRLRHRIKLQKNTPTLDAAGQPVESWSTYLETWATVEDESGKEDDGQPIEGLVKATAVMRYPHRGVIPQPSHRFLHGEGDVLRTINIEAVKRLDGQRRMLKLIGTEHQNG